MTHHRLSRLWQQPRTIAVLSAALAFGLLCLAALAADRWYTERLINEQRARLTIDLALQGRSHAAVIERRLARLQGLVAFAEAELHNPAELIAEFEAYARATQLNSSAIYRLSLTLNGLAPLVYPLTATDELSSNAVGAPPVDALQPGAPLTRVGQPFSTRPGTLWLNASRPVIIDSEVVGRAAMTLDLASVLNEAHQDTLLPAVRMALRDKSGYVFYGDAAVFDLEPVITTIELSSAVWEIAAVPYSGWTATFDEDRRLFQLAELLIVLPMTGLVYLTVSRQARLARAVEMRTRELAQLAQTLENDIAERRQAEIQRGAALSALQLSEQLYQSLVDALPYSLYRIDRNGGLIFANRALLEALGMPLADALGKSAHDFYPPELAAKYRADDQWVMDTGQIFTCVEEHILPRTGEKVYMEVMKLPVRDAAGNIIGVQGMFWDVTDRARAQATLRASEEKFAAAFEHAPVMITISSLEDGRYLEVNECFLKVSGFSRDEVIGRTSIELGWLTADDRQRLIETLKRHGHVADLELALTAKDGRRVQCLYNGEYITVNGQQRLLSIALDISERQAAAEALRLTNHRQQALVKLNEMTAVSERELLASALEDAVQLTDSQIGYWHFVHADQNHLDLFLWSRATHDVCECKTQTHYALSEAGIWTDCIRRRGAVVHNDYASAPGRRGLPPGHAPVQRHMSVPLFDDEGRVLAIAGVGNKRAPYTDADVDRLTDFVNSLWAIVQRRRAQEALRQINADLEQRVAERTRALAAANERLRELDQLKSRFVSDVSHELRTPVTSLKLYLELLDHGKPEKRAQYLASINEQANRMVQLIEDILDLSRLERDKNNLAFDLIDLNAVLERVVIDLRPRAEAAGLQLKFEPGVNLPPIQGEINRLLQVGTNLITNAINYTPAGEVRVRSYAADHAVCFEVADTGLGIETNDLPHLFERFYRGRRASQSGVRGTGLGLSIVKDIVDLHGGQIGVSSVVNVGSTFRVNLPAAR